MIIKIITIITVIILFYGNTLFNGFVHDDLWQIVENQNLRSIGNLPKIFSTCIAEEILGTCKNIGFYYRPLQFVSYFFTYQISKDAWAFHLVNLLYTFVLGIFVFKFFENIFQQNMSLRPPPLSLRSASWRRSNLTSMGLPRRPDKSGLLAMTNLARNDGLAFLATIFFLAHPINSEVVNWIGAVPELLLGILTIAMLIFYIKFSESGKVGFLIGAGFLYFLALISKEAGFFSLGLIVLYEIVYVGIKRGRERLQKYFKVFVFYLVPLSLYLILRVSVLGRIAYEYEGYYSMSFLQQIGNAISLFPQYVLKLFYPMPLSLQHSFTPIAGVNIGVIFGILLLLVNGFLLYLAIAKKQKILIFGFFFFLVTLAPYLIFINKLGEFVISERYLFLPSIGFTLIVFELLSMSLRGARLVGRRSNLYRKGIASLISFARNDKRERGRNGKNEATGSHLVGSRVFFCLFAVYLGISWFIVFNRNKDWKDNLSSYLSIVRAYPNNKKASAQAYTLLFKLSSKKFAKDNIAFLYPSGWKIGSCHPEASDEGSNCIRIKSSDNTFTIEIRQDSSASSEPAHISVEEYLEKQTSSLGTLINQGSALIPNVDKAYVKIWQDKEENKMQFFLFKKDAVVEIRAWPGDSVHMKDFDEILRSLSFP